MFHFKTWKRKLYQPGPQGFSLLEILIAIGLFSLVAMGFASFAKVMFAELRAANQKMEVITLESDIQLSLRMNTEACNTMIAPLSFNPNLVTGSSGPVITLPNGILTSLNPQTFIAQPGQPLLGTTSGLVVDATELEIIREVNPSLYEGVFWVRMDPDSTVRSLAPISTRYFLSAEPGTGNLTGCSPQPVGPPCPDGEVLIGLLEDGEPLCQSITQALAGLSCPATTYLAGFTDNGDPDCQALPEIPPAPEPGEGEGGGMGDCIFECRIESCYMDDGWYCTWGNWGPQCYGGSWFNDGSSNPSDIRRIEVRCQP